jgi:hypothetical protein
MLENNFYIYQHLGLGDHVICNGLLREIINSSEIYYLFTKPSNMISVSFMFKDLKNLLLIEVTNDEDVISFIQTNQISKDRLIIVGFKFSNQVRYFDESFYVQHGVSFEKRWSSFKVDRDLDQESKLFDYFGVEENNYVFVHDDSKRNMVINEDLIVNKDLKIIRPIKHLTNNIFDYCLLMERSRELHFIDSSFKLVFDSMFYNNKKFNETNTFFHLKLKDGKYRNNEKYSFADGINSKIKFKIID